MQGVHWQLYTVLLIQFIRDIWRWDYFCFVNLFIPSFIQQIQVVNKREGNNHVENNTVAKNSKQA
jgi:hypothetical protein